MGALAVVSPDIMGMPGIEFSDQLNRGETVLLYVLFAASGVCFAVATAALALAFRKLP